MRLLYTIYGLRGWVTWTIKFEVEEIQLANKYEALAWICKNQLGRRNLSPERKKFLLGKEYESTKLAVGGQPGNCNKVNRCDQNDHIDSEKRTCERIAVEHGVGSATVRRAEKYMNGVEAADEAAPGAREEILNGKIKAADREICAIAKAPKEQRPEIVAELRKPKSERDKQLASSTKSPSVKVESFDDDGNRFLIGISKKMQGHKRALTESDQKALKKSVDNRYFRKAPADHSIHIAAIEGAYDAFKMEREQQEVAIRQQKHNELVRRLKAGGFSDTAMLDWNFENDDGRAPQMHYAHRYVEQWQTMRAENLGLLLWGGVGTGKSFLAGCIANALMEQEVSVRMTNFARIMNELNNSFSGRNVVVDRLCHYPLLIIDDFGMERGTKYALEQVYNIVDSRYRSQKPLIVTTNLPLNEIRHPQDTAHARIYDRILEMCVPISCIGASLRKENAQKKLESMKSLIG